MKPTTLYYIGSGILGAGLACMCAAMYKQGKEDAQQESVWTEADKEVIGEPETDVRS